jgi:hypothetical protein
VYLHVERNPLRLSVGKKKKSILRWNIRKSFGWVSLCFPLRLRMEIFLMKCSSSCEAQRAREGNEITGGDVMHYDGEGDVNIYLFAIYALTRLFSLVAYFLSSCEC